MSISSSFIITTKKRWWITNRKLVERYVREAKEVIENYDQRREIRWALNLLDTAISLSPRNDRALELKALCLLNLGRFKDVVTMLQDYLPSLRISSSSSLNESSPTSSSELSPSQLSKRERVKLLSTRTDSVDHQEPVFKCFSVSGFKNKLLSGLGKNYENQGQWRYVVLGQACCHLGMMEDAMELLQTGKRLATAAFRRESISLSNDSFSSLSRFQCGSSIRSNHQESPDITELLTHIKLLLRRKTLAVAALDAGLHCEAVRHFSKIVDSRRGVPQGFLADCYLHRASAYQSAGRFAEAIADCNRTLALEPSCLAALHSRAVLFEIVCSYPDSLHDLEHLKLLYNSILRDRKLPGPKWKGQDVQYREIPGKLCSLATKIQELKQRVALGRTVNNVDNYALMGLCRGCTRSELERAYRLLMLRHKPEKSSAFMETCEFEDEHESDSVRDRARMSALLLYRLIQRGYASLMDTIKKEEAAENSRNKNAGVIHAGQGVLFHQPISIFEASVMVDRVKEVSLSTSKVPNSSRTGNKDRTTLSATTPSVFLGDRVFDNKATHKSKVNNMATTPVIEGVFWRDPTVVGNLLSQTGFNNHLPVNYAGLSC